MNEYEFTLKYRLGDDDRDFDEVIERLGDAGCTDALVGVGVVGRVSLNFTREARSAGEAVMSAIADAKSAIPSATLVEITPDLVGLSDIAEILDIARQNVRKAMESNADFPAPVHEGNPAVWRLATVLKWYAEKKNRNFPQWLRDLADCAAAVNVLLQISKVPALGFSERTNKTSNIVWFLHAVSPSFGEEKASRNFRSWSDQMVDSRSVRGRQKMVQRSM